VRSVRSVGLKATRSNALRRACYIAWDPRGRPGSSWELDQRRRLRLGYLSSGTSSRGRTVGED